jgi:hypothetical protein
MLANCQGELWSAKASFCAGKKVGEQRSVVKPPQSGQLLALLSSEPEPEPTPLQVIVLVSEVPNMVKLTEVEDEHFADKPAATKDDALLASDDDDDYTDTGREPHIA